MRTRLLKLFVLTAVVAVPAAALAADATIYSGTADSDPVATIELKVVKEGGEKQVKKIVVDGLEYNSGLLCASSGRTPKETLTGSFPVKGNGEFRAVGATVANDPLDNGQLNVVGDVALNKVTGEMRFTFGKTGCKTDKKSFTAHK